MLFVLIFYKGPNLYTDLHVYIWTEEKTYISVAHHVEFERTVKKHYQMKKYARKN